MSKKEIAEYIKKSFELRNQGHFKLAIEMLYKALSLDENSVEILVQLADLYTLLKNNKRACYYIEKVLEIDPNHIDCLQILKSIQIEEGDMLCARDSAQRIFEIQPTSHNFAQKLKILIDLGEFSHVFNYEHAGVELTPEVLFEVSKAYMKNNDFSRAIEVLESAYCKDSANLTVLFELAKNHFYHGDYERARYLFGLMEKDSSDADVFNYLGLFKLNDYQYENAVEYFTKAMRINDNCAEYIFNLASAYFLNGWMDEAQKLFTRAISIAPQNIDYHYALAYLYFQGKQYEKASFEIDYIKTLNPDHEMTLVLEALIKAAKGDSFGAKAALEEMVKKNPLDDFAIFALGKIYLEFDMKKRAKDMFQCSLTLRPSSHEYLEALVSLEIEDKNFEDAHVLVSHMMDVNPKYVNAYILRAKIHLIQGNYQSLFDSAQDIIELDANNPQGYYYNALALFEQGDFVFAFESLKKSISLDLNNAQLYVKMSEFYQETGDLKEAYDWAKEAAEVDSKSFENKWLCAQIASLLKNNEDALKYYSQSYRLSKGNADLAEDYANFLKKNGREKQAKTILNSVLR